MVAWFWFCRTPRFPLSGVLLYSKLRFQTEEAAIAAGDPHWGPYYSGDAHFRWHGDHPRITPPLVQQSRWNPENDDLVIGALRLVTPAPPPPNFIPVIRDIRGSASNTEATVTLFRSVQPETLRIVLTPIARVSEDGILYINLDISPEIRDGSGLEEYNRLWREVIARAAPQLTADLASGIEASLSVFQRSE